MTICVYDEENLASKKSQRKKSLMKRINKNKLIVITKEKTQIVLKI